MLQTYKLSVTYEGKNFPTTKDNLYALTPALFAFANVIKATIKIVQPQTQPVKIEIVTGPDYSFVYNFQSQDQYTFDNLIKRIKAEPIKQALDFPQLFADLDAVFNLIKRTHHHKIVDQQAVSEANVQIYFDDGDFLTTSKLALAAYQNQCLQQDIANTLAPLKTMLLESFEIFTESAQTIRVRKSELNHK